MNATPLRLALPYARDAKTVFSPLLRLPAPVLLHSAATANGFGRYDIMSADPVSSVRYQEGIFHSGNRQTPTDAPLTLLAREHKFFAQGFPTAQNAEIKTPFAGGFLGYFGYGLHQHLERHRPAPKDPVGIPTLAGGFYDFSVVTDHAQQTTTLYAAERARQQQVAKWLNDTQETDPALPQRLGRFAPSTDNNSYLEQFAAIQRYLAQGDTYQVNLAVHYQAQYDGHPWLLYQQWCQRQPAPFNAYLELSSHPSSASGQGRTPSAIISLSPERFLQVNGGNATVSPIKGTRPRGATADEDQALAQQLRLSAKDQAENLMIVDLLRNDLGRVCQVGSVRVADLFDCVPFHNVHHLVSTITGTLLPNVSTLDAFTSLFPSGSITGAPKLRAIDIINELEPVGRSIYCGSIGYWDAGGNFDSSVAIRTAALHDQQLHLWGGGGVVTDSNAASEQREIQAKIGRLLDASG